MANSARVAGAIKLDTQAGGAAETKFFLIRLRHLLHVPQNLEKGKKTKAQRQTGGAEGRCGRSNSSSTPKKGGPEQGSTENKNFVSVVFIIFSMCPQT